MHVLGLPPAFVLSQDQTLKLEHDPTVSRWNIRDRRILTSQCFSKLSLKLNPNQQGMCIETSDSRSFCLKSRRPTQARKPVRWVRPARTPPSTFLFLKLQCQRARSRWKSLPKKLPSWLRPPRGCPRCGGRFRPQTRCPVNRAFAVFFNFFAVTENPATRPKKSLPPLSDLTIKPKAASPPHSNSDPRKCRPNCP